MTGTEYVWLELKRNRGYPWPEGSYGLDPMFGPDGWCRSCGVPSVEQRGSLVLQRRRSSNYHGAWVPNWQFDAFCVDALLADEVRQRFTVEMLPVAWHGAGTGEASQIVARPTRSAWFDRTELTERTSARHGSPGRSCPTCGVWRWYPLYYRQLPAVLLDAAPPVSVIASPEWFGDGLQAYRHVLFQRELAELIASASPRDFKVVAADVRIAPA